MDDAKIRSAVAGNARARAAVLRALQDGWYRYAVANLLSVSAARDAVQEAGLRVLQRLSSYDSAEPIETWTLGAVIQAVRELRQLNGAPPPLLATARRAGLSPLPPKYNRASADVADGLSAVLAAMPPDQREAVVLCGIQKRSTGVTTRLLGIDARAIRASLRAVPRSGQGLRATLEVCRDWSDLGRYPANLTHELFRAHKPRWLIPAALGTLAASVVLISVAGHYRSAVPATQPTTRRGP